MKIIERCESNGFSNPKKLVLNVIFVFIFFSCSQTKTDNKIFESKEKNKAVILRKSYLEDTVSLRVLKAGYIFSFKGQKQEVANQDQLLELLKKSYNRQDTLYVFIEDAFDDKITETLKSINDLKINKRKIVITNNYFKFPY